MGNNFKLIYDGNIVDAQEPIIAGNSRGLMYGDGCFETLRWYGGSFLHLGEHLKRFKAGADFLGIAYPDFFESNNLKSALKQLLKKNDLIATSAVIRFQLWRGGERGYETAQIDRSHFTVAATPLPTIKESVKLALVQTKRIPNAALPSSYKLSNNINYIASAHEAAQKGADDALMQTTEGYISETTIANIFWASGNEIYTPSADCDLLPGITRKIVIRLCEKLFDKPLEQGKYRIEDIQNADAVWICNSVREIVPVSALDKTNFRVDHPIIKKLKTEFINYKELHLSE